MPLIPLDQRDIGTRLALVKIEAVMLAPDDEKVRERLLEAGTIAFGRDVLKEAAENGQELPTMPAGLAHWMASELPAIQAPKTPELRFRHGVIAGLTFLDMLTEDATRPGRASEAAAIGRISEIPGLIEWTRRSTGTLRSIWSRFRCVSHIWAAYQVEGREMGECFPCRSDRIDSFIARAEGFRRKGEEVRCYRASMPILGPKGSAWRFPDQNSLRARAALDAVGL